MEKKDVQPYQNWPEAKWRTVSEAEGRSRYNLIDASDDSIDYDELFGGDPFEFAVHDGELTVSGSVHAENRSAKPTVYVVEGDVVVEGTLALSDTEIYIPLWIRGTLSARQLYVGRDAHLFVEGDLHVSDCLITNLNDAGHLVVQGKTLASAWLSPSERGAVSLTSDLELLDRSALQERLRPGLSADDLLKHALADQPLLRSE